MNKSVTSKEIILEESKKIMRESGPELLGMREIAKRCGISVGSVYNYYPSKESLIADTLEAIWTEIMHGEKDMSKEKGFLESVALLYEKISKGSERYPLFLSTQSMLFDKMDKFEGKDLIGHYENHIIKGLVRALKMDDRVNKNAFNSTFPMDVFVEFIFTNILKSINDNSQDLQFILELIKRLVY
ncbi:MAG: TetR/AcrR family transcriptional regulator [Clostridiaceae bacterium]